MTEDKKKLSRKVMFEFHSWKRLLSLARPEVKTLVAATFFLVIAAGASLAFPRIAGVVIDGAIAEGLGAVNRAALLMIAAFGLMAIAAGFRYYLFSLAGYRIVTRLRATTYTSIIQQEIGFFDQRKTGELLSRLSSDTTTVQNAVSVNISMLMRGIAAVLGGIIMLIWRSPVLAALMLVVIPPVSLGSVFFGRKIRLLSKAFQDALAEAGEVAEETLAGVRTVRSFTRENHESDRYTEKVDASLAVQRRNLVFTGLFQAVITFAGYGVIALVLWYGGRLVVQGEMSTGELTEFILYTLMVAFSLGMLAGLWSDFMRAMGAAERIFDIIDRQPEVPFEGGDKPEGLAGRIAFDKVSFSYPARPDVAALGDVTFTIQPGEVVALVGPSGSGKSTIGSLIPRFYDPVSGAITVDDHALVDLDPRWLRGHIGAVPQDPMLFSNSIEENIGYGRDHYTREEIEAAARAANAHDFILDFPEGYETEVGERGVQLSGGQRQRVAIARAVLKDPRILILDEATSALDAESEYLVKQALDRLMKNRTTLIIAHRLSTVKDADRVIVLDSGRIAESGTHEELMTHEQGLYRKLVERQFMHEMSNAEA